MSPLIFPFDFSDNGRKRGGPSREKASSNQLHKYMSVCSCVVATAIRELADVGSDPQTLPDVAGSNREVANRPGRLEPRVLRRRRHGYPLMQISRTVLRNELRNRCT